MGMQKIKENKLRHFCGLFNIFAFIKITLPAHTNYPTASVFVFFLNQDIVPKIYWCMEDEAV